MCYECLLAIPHRLVPVSVSLPSSVVSRIVKSCAVLECTMYMYVQQSYHCTFYKLALTRISSRHFEKRGEIRVFRNKQGGGGGRELHIPVHRGV